MKQFLVTVCAFVLWAEALFAQTFPDYQELYVNDFAALLSAEQESDLRSMLAEIRTERGIEFTVVTIGSISDYGHNGEIEPFATGLFNYWGVGDADRNDGIMMLIARYDRDMRIEVGSGYGSSLDGPMKAIIEDEILPYFRDDEYGEGILNGAQEVVYELVGSYPGEYDATVTEKAVNRALGFLRWIGNWIWLIAAPFLYFPIRAFRHWQRHRPRICPVEGSKMQMLGEDWDDDHLKPGQVTEEEIKSIDYDVWQCPTCDNVTIEAYRSWFSRYGACRSCGFRTVQGETTIVTPATTSSTGKKRIDYNCHHCQDTWTGWRTIPMKSESSSSSSSGSSFGGGSSSGGGASGSW